jgi:uncharacterized membrane protein
MTSRIPPSSARCARFPGTSNKIVSRSAGFGNAAPGGWKVVGQLLGMVFYPFVVHLLISLDLSWLAVIGLIVTSSIYVFLVINMQRRTGANPAWVWLYLTLAVTGIWSLSAHNVYALFVPPFVINLALGIAFGLTLLPGRVPLVEWFIRLEHAGAVPPVRLAEFARAATWAWVVYMTGIACLSVILAFTVKLETWSLVVNVLNYIFAIAMLFAQFAWRSLFLPEYGVRMPWHTLRAMAHSPWPGRAAPVPQPPPVSK